MSAGEERHPNDSLSRTAKKTTKKIFYWIITALVLLFVGLIVAWYLYPRDRYFQHEIDKLKARTFETPGLPYARNNPRHPTFLAWSVLPPGGLPLSPALAVLHPRTDWPQWRGPARNGIGPDVPFRTKWQSNGPPVLWEKSVGEGYSSFAIVDNRVLTMMRDGTNEAVVCWDVQSGVELWRYRYPASYHNRYGSGPRATPTVVADFVYTVGATGILNCLSLSPGDSNGKRIWSVDLLTKFGASNLDWGVSFSPLVEGDLVFTMPGGAGGGSLAAFDRYTGKLIWQKHDDKAGYASPIAATIHGRRQVIFFTARGLISVEPNSGKKLWRFDWETDYGANIATPIVLDNYVFLSSGYSKGCALLRIGKDNDSWTVARVYQTRRMQTHFSSCVLYRDHIYGFDTQFLECLDFRTGKVRWKQRGFNKGALMAANGFLIILGENGKLAVAKARPDGYEETAQHQFSKKQCWVVPVLADGRLYVRDQSRVVCYDVSMD